MTPRLFGRVWVSTSLKLMSYRADFWITAFAAFAIEIVTVYFLWTAIFAANGGGTIAGFSLPGMVFYYVVAILVARLVSGQERDYNVSDDIYQGALTRYLLYPSPYFGFKYAEHLGAMVPAMLQLFVCGAVSLAVFGVPEDVHVTPLSVAMALVSIGVANLLNFVMVFPLQAVSFWADNVWSLLVMYRFIASMLGGVMLPLSLYPEAAQRALAFLPFEYLFYVPVMTLLGRVSAGDWLLGLAVSLGWTGLIGLAARAVWKRGTLGYTGVGI